MHVRVDQHQLCIVVYSIEYRETEERNRREKQKRETEKRNRREKQKRETEERNRREKQKRETEERNRRKKKERTEKRNERIMYVKSVLLQFTRSLNQKYYSLPEPSKPLSHVRNSSMSIVPLLSLSRPATMALTASSSRSSPHA